MLGIIYWPCKASKGPKQGILKRINDIRLNILLSSSIIWNSSDILYKYPWAGVSAKWYDVLWEISRCPGWDRPQAVNLAPARTRMLQHYIRDLESRNVELLQTHKLNWGKLGQLLWDPWLNPECRHSPALTLGMALFVLWDTISWVSHCSEHQKLLIFTPLHEYPPDHHNLPIVQYQFMVLFV